MPYFYSQKEYEQYEYRRSLKKTSNGIGLLLILFMMTELVFSLVMIVIGVVSGQDILDALYETFGLTLLNGVYSLVTFFFVGVIFCLIRREDFSRLFPFKRAGAGYLAMLVVIGVTLALLSNYVADAVTDMFGMFGLSSSYSGSAETEGAGSVFMSYLTIAFIPAVAEEFAFRGIIMGMLRKYSDALALIVSAAIFGLMHGNMIQIPFAFCGGLIFGFVALKTNSLLPGILIHFFNNAISVTFDLLYNNSHLPENLVDASFYVLIILLAVLSIFFIRRIIRTKQGFFSFPDSNTVVPFRDKMKTVCSSPTLIVYAVMIVIYTILAETVL